MTDYLLCLIAVILITQLVVANKLKPGDGVGMLVPLAVFAAVVYAALYSIIWAAKMLLS